VFFDPGNMERATTRIILLASNT